MKDVSLPDSESATDHHRNAHGFASLFSHRSKKRTPSIPEKGRATIITIGRSPDNSLVLDEESVSDRHAEIIHSGNIYYIRDLNSQYGTRVNGKPVKMTQLKDGELIEFGTGDASFRFTMEHEEEEKPPEVDEKIDLSQLSRKKVVERPAAAEEPPASHQHDVANLQSVAPAVAKASELPPSQPAVAPAKKTDILSKRWDVLPPWGMQAGIALFGLLMFLGSAYYHSHSRQKHAYDLGYHEGLSEFGRPPRNLNLAMIERLGKPAFTRAELGDSQYPDYMKGLKAAAFKNYYNRYHSPPHLE